MRLAGILCGVGALIFSFLGAYFTPSKVTALQYNCPTLDALLVKNSHEAYYAKLDRGRNDKPANWRVIIESTDREFKFTAEHHDLCEAMHIAWSRLEAYNAYAHKGTP